MTKHAKKTTKLNPLEQEDANRAKRIARGKELSIPKRKAKPATVHPLPAPKPEAKPAKGSVVPQRFKVKAGKSGVMNGDDLGTAIKNAFLFHGSNDRTAQETARIATDELLQDNGLDVGRWAGKNPGMLRMNVTNVLRGIRRNGEPVIVRGKSYKAQ